MNEGLGGGLGVRVDDHSRMASDGGVVKRLRNREQFCLKDSATHRKAEQCYLFMSNKGIPVSE